MPEDMPDALMPDNTLLIIIGVLTVLGFLTAYYFIRKSLQPTEDFDNRMFRKLTREDKNESLQYCVSFFQDAYDANELPDLSVFMELRLKASIVLTFYKSVRRAAYVYSKLRGFYYMDRPLPDLTDRFKQRLKEDGRGGDIVSAFCLCGIEEFERLEEQTSL
jgi:hypothetical protein